MTSYWRSCAAPIIARVLEETKFAPEPDRAAALRAAYPFGVRRHHPYTIWLDEIRVQTGQKRLKPRVRQQQDRPPEPSDERQFTMFEEQSE